MKDIPMFTTEYGVASLSLREIPYRKEAYIHIRDAWQIHPLLEECIRFCRMCGAERIYATGHSSLEEAPLQIAVYQMRGAEFGEAPAFLWPVTRENVTQWRSIHNEAMAGVDAVSTLTAGDDEKLLSSPGACFVHDGEKLLGIGWYDNGELLALASVIPGKGKVVLQAMLSLAQGAPVTLEVASTNDRAIRLYERCGFIKTKEVRRWYCVY